MASRTDTAADETRWVRTIRRLYHRYRDGRLRVGHPILRRLLQASLGRRQRIQLSNDLRLELDLGVPLQQTLFWLDGGLEPQLSWAIREFVPPRGTFVDCGANCGYFGLEARATRQAQVLFIEPHPRLAASVRANLALNGWSADCVVVEAAASDQEGSATLYLCRENDGSHSLLPNWTPPASQDSTVEVRRRTLAGLLAELPQFAQVDFLKVDTEGHDWKVLQGLGRYLDPTQIKCLYTELGRDRELAVHLLEARGYTGFVARAFRSGVLARRLARQSEQADDVAFFRREDLVGSQREILWCAQGSVAARRLETLASSAD